MKDRPTLSFTLEPLCSELSDQRVLVIGDGSRSIRAGEETVNRFYSLLRDALELRLSPPRLDWPAHDGHPLSHIALFYDYCFWMGYQDGDELVLCLYRKEFAGPDDCETIHLSAADRRQALALLEAASHEPAVRARRPSSL